MRKIAYWFCFTLVAAPAIVSLVNWPLALLGTGIPFPPSMVIFFSFGSLVPQMLSPSVPGLVHVLLGFGMLFLVLRRIWLFIQKGERLPATFRGFQQMLGYIGFCSLVLALLVLLLAVVLGAGSGVLAGMLTLPAIICIPWAFFLTEVFSMRRVAAPGEVEPLGRVD
jgi:hypothetical protein